MRPRYERETAKPAIEWACDRGTTKGARERRRAARAMSGGARAVLAAAIMAMVGIGSGFAPSIARADPPPNILFVVIDDLGADRLALTTDYDPSSPWAPPPTPSIDALAADGVLFRNAYASPTCSPARALIMTGRHGYRTGIGDPIPPNQEEVGFRGLDLDEDILSEVLARGAGYSTAFFGKWHLGHACDLASGSSEDHGFDRFYGTRGNFGGAGTHYRNWPRIDRPFSSDCDGFETEHATEAVVDEAVAWIGAQTQPWFCVVAFSAVHDPMQYPSAPGPASTQDPALPILDAMIEHTDRNIGELLLGIDPQETMVFLMGDNGTDSAVSGPGQTIFPPYDPSHGKGNVYEQGVHVPFIVSGPYVEVALPQESDALVSLVDLFRTVTEIVGIPLPADIAEDSVSFTEVLDGTGPGPRSTVYSELFSPNRPQPGEQVNRHYRSLRNAGYKLIHRHVPGEPMGEEFYDLTKDPYEQNPLSPAALDPIDDANYQALLAEMATIPFP